MTDHTPGPWYVCDNGHIRQEASDAVIAELRDGGHIDPDAQLIDPDAIEANAHLIAAAPDTAAERDRLKAIGAEMAEALAGLLPDGWALVEARPPVAKASAALAKWKEETK